MIFFFVTCKNSNSFKVMILVLGSTTFNHFISQHNDSNRSLIMSEPFAFDQLMLIFDIDEKYI